MEECDSAFAVIYPYEYDNEEEVQAIAKRLEKFEEVSKTVCVRKHYVSEKLTSGKKEIETFTNLTEYDREVFGKVRCVEGTRKDFENLKDWECVVPACICVENNLKLGDDLTVQMPGGDLTYTIKGIYSEIYSTSNAFDSYILVKKIPAQVTAEMGLRLYKKDNVTEEQILDYFEHNCYYRTVPILESRRRCRSKIYIQVFGYTWILDSVDEENDRATFYSKELNLSIVGKLHPYDRVREDKVTLLYPKLF